MIGIIQDWLFNQLGINFDFDNLSKTNIFKDGLVLVDIFKKYGLISHGFGYVTSTSNNVQCNKNLCLLKPLFNLLKVNYSDRIILEIVEGKVSTIIKLLYELYICLENKQHLYFIKQMFYNAVQSNIIDCTNIEQLNVSKKSNINIQPKNYILQQTFFINKDIINWYERKYTVVKNNLDTKLNFLKQEICQENTLKGDEKKVKCSCNDVNGTALPIEPFPNLYMYPTCKSHDKLLNYEEFIINHKNNLKEKVPKTNFENGLQNEILSRTWSKIIENQNIVYNNIFSDILLKQSQYEKQILNKLVSTQKQIEVQDENQIIANKLVLDEFEYQVNDDLKLKEAFLDLELIYRNEQKRVLDLHKKLYKEKQDLKKNVTIGMCKDIISELTDIAMVASDYKLKYGHGVSRSLWNNWMKLFMKGKPVHIPFENMKDTVSDITEIEYDNIIRFEKYHDEVLNENDVEEYLLTSGRWFFKDICLETGTYRDDIISFIVYRLLSLKYPSTETHSAADIPPFKSATILLNFHNSSSIDKLKMLLSKRKIHVFNTENAVTKSINTFIKETLPLPEEEKKKNKDKSGSKNNRNKPLISKSKPIKKKSKTLEKNDKNKKKSKSVLPAQQIENQLENKNNFLFDKDTQTSDVEEVQPNAMIRTELGLIGQEVSRLLNEGKEVNDSLVVKVIVEYLKTLEDCEGWLLLNYPNTLYQASELELALTGRAIPLEDYISHEEYDLNINLNIKEDFNKITSKLYLPPEISKDNMTFLTHFSQIIMIKDSESLIPDSNKDNRNNDIGQNEKKVKHGEEELLYNITTLQDKLLFKQFYSDQAVYKEFNDDITDLNNIKMLARFILKEDSINTTNSIELFGEEIINKLSNLKPKTKKNKVLSPKEKTKFTSKTKGSNVNTTALKQNELDDNSKLESTKLDTLNITEHLQTIEPITINPGEPGWEYITLPINSKMAVLLAEIWENIENCYISQLKDIFFQNRMINLRLVPYYSFVKEEIEKINNKPDIKQDIVNLFTKYYNNIDNNLRTLPEVKSQLHCKVLEMQQDLWQISDTDKKEKEAKRQQIIIENWVANELCLLVNNYLCLIQCESERTYETMKLIQNYYLSALYEYPSTAGNAKISKPLLGKISTNTFLKSNKISLSLSDKNYPVGPDSEDAIKSQSSNNIIVSSLINCHDNDTIFEVVNESLLKEIRKANLDIKRIFDILCSQIKMEDKLLFYNNENEVKGKKNHRDRHGSQSVNNRKPIKNITEQSTNLKADDNDTYRMKKLLLLEWHIALSNEENRFGICSELIRKKCEENIMEFYCYLENVFCELQESALSKYAYEISNINKLCEYLHIAIEEESPLSHTPILAKSTFFINKTGSIKPKQEQYELKELTEETELCYFTMKQLNKLMAVFRIAGPYGVVRKQPFCYILQDLMLFNSNDNQPHLPEMWHRLNESQLRDVIENTFGTAYAVDWRDFIIYNLEISYPSTTDILNLKHSFLIYDLNESETIRKEDYDKIMLWFEVDLPSNPAEVLKLALTKELLFEMFKVNEDHTNYTTLLLYFCKDYEPHNGLRKALCLSVGKQVIISKNELNEIIQNDLEKKDNAQKLLTDIINGVVMNREGVLMYDIYDHPSKFNIKDDDKINHSDSTTDSIFMKTSSSISHMSAINIAMEIEKSNGVSKETDDDFKKSWISRLPVATVISVLNTLFHNQDKKYDLRNIYLDCLEEESDADGMIEGHGLMALSCMQKLFNATNKFKISSPCRIIQQCLNNNI